MRALALMLLVAVSSPALARAQDDPLASAGGDPVRLAQAAARLGDAAVLARLDAARPRPVRLAAVRATPFLHAPERALAALAALAGGRDPLLAPAAALAVARIARALDGPSLDAREAERAELAPARAALATLAADASARADIRRAAALAASLLASLGVP